MSRPDVCQVRAQLVNDVQTFVMERWTALLASAQLGKRTRGESVGRSEQPDGQAGKQEANKRSGQAAECVDKQARPVSRCLDEKTDVRLHTL